MRLAADRNFRLGMILSVIDLLTFNIIYFFNRFFALSIFPEDRGNIVVSLLLSNLAYIISLQYVNISLHHRMSKPANVLNNTSRTSALFMVIYAAMLGILGYRVPGLSTSLLLIITIFIFTTIERLLLRNYIMHKRNIGRNSVSTLILGSGDMVQKVANVMTDTWNGYNLIGYFHETEADKLTNVFTNEEISYLGNIKDLVSFIEKRHVDELYIDNHQKDKETMKVLLRLCEKRMIRIYYIPVSDYKEFRNARIMEFGDVYIISQYNEPLSNVRKRIYKRTFDIVFSLLFLCTLFPIFLIITAIISKLSMPGPLFFKQKRTGYDGKDFYCYKFRSMKVNKDSDTVQATKNDTRVTKCGQFMRHTNIDELPQFINVLKGDMSVVGPRPHMLAHTDYYSDLISDYMIRHYVKPGITGWAQTHGERGETKTVDDMRRRVEKDIWYIEHWSFWLDIQIIFKTIGDAIHGDEKAY